MKFTVETFVRFFTFAKERYGKQIMEVIADAACKGLEWAMSMVKEWAANKITSLIAKVSEFIRSFASAAFA
jgi:hypothetical protein